MNEALGEGLLAVSQAPTGQNSPWEENPHGGGGEGLYSSLTLLPPTARVGKDTMPHREVGQAEKTWVSQGTCPLDEHSPRGQGSVNCPSLPFLSRGPGTEDGDLVQCLVRATRGSFEPTGS